MSWHWSSLSSHIGHIPGLKSKQYKHHTFIDSTGIYWWFKMFQPLEMFGHLRCFGEQNKNSLPSFFSKFLFIFGERGREGKRKRNIDRNINQLPLICVLTWDQTCNPGKCPDQEWDWWSFIVRHDAQPTKPHWSGHPALLKLKSLEGETMNEKYHLEGIKYVLNIVVLWKYTCLQTCIYITKKCITSSKPFFFFSNVKALSQCQ